VTTSRDSSLKSQDSSASASAHLGVASHEQNLMTRL